MVQLVSPTNQLLPPQLLSSILSSTDLTTNTIILSSSDPPIVRMHDRQTYETRLRDLALKNSLRDRTKFEEKEIQISWTSATGDMEHKIEMAKNILAKGDRVSVLFAIKGSPRRDRMTSEEKKEMIKVFEDGLEEVGRKWQDDLIKGKAVALHYEPKEEVREEFVAKFKEKILEEKKEKGDRKEARRKKDEERRLASKKD
jgi:translation initiation factor IF-3